jgi:hypothetical protein
MKKRKDERLGTNSGQQNSGDIQQKLKTNGKRIKKNKMEMEM